MRLGSLRGRLVVVKGDRVLDVSRATGGKVAADPQAALADWERTVDILRGNDLRAVEAQPFDLSDLSAPVPRPGQVFAIGVNYRRHAEEASFAVPEAPMVFTKFPSAITGPSANIGLPTGPAGCVDWEIELVVVMGRSAHKVSASAAWEYVAGVTVGQDISERAVQLKPPAPQFSMGKSFPGFAPIGPFIVTPDELPDRNNLRLSCSVNGETVQDGRTSDMVFSVTQLIEYLSSIVTLRPGDLIFTGTPDGVGGAMKPPRYLRDGDILESEIEGLGRMTHRFLLNSPGSEPNPKTNFANEEERV